MLEFRTLGRLELTDGTGRELSSALKQPKRLALLAYLALASPRRLHRRDRVLAVFWPELDESRARHSLSQALHFLRRALGEGVIVTRGAHDVGLDAGRLWCDAVAFEDALDADDPAGALELYGGDLLDGLFVSDAPAFERWLDQRRGRLRRRAARAAAALAERAEANGDLESAVRRARRAASLAPFDEAAARRLIALLDRVGDRASAMRAYESFTDRLAAELELDPAPETRELAARIRRRAEPAPAEPTLAGSAPRAPAPAGSVDRPGAGGAEASPDPTAAPVDIARKPRRTGRRRRRRRALALGVALLVLTVAWGAAYVWRTPPADASPDTTRLAVLPFSYRGSDEFAYLGAGMAELLAMTLDDAGELRTIDSRAVLTFVGREAPAGTPVPEEGRRAAEYFRARLYALGDVVEAGGRLRISAGIYDLERGSEPVARVAVEGGAEELFRLVDELSAGLLTGRPEVPGDRLTRIAAHTTSSLPALKAYLEGEQALQAGGYSEAIEAFRRATALDTTFALAYYRLSVAAEWAPRPELMHAAAERAVRQAARLAERDRLLLRASRAWRRGDAAEAERRYRAILRTYPDDLEAREQLAEVLFHYNPLRGRPVAESGDAWRRVLRLEPENQAARLHLARVQAAEHRADALDAVVRPALSDGDADHDRRVLQSRLLRALAKDDRAEEGRVAALLERASDGASVDIWYVAAFTRNLEGAARLLRRLLAPAQSPEMRAVTHIMLAHVEIARGRWRAAATEFDAAAALDPARALPHRALVATLPFAPVSRSELEALRADLERWDADRVRPGANPRPVFRIHDGLHPSLRTYLLGLLSARLGDAAAAARHAAFLDGVDGPARARAIATDLARSVRAHIARAQGRTDAALELLEAVETSTTFERAFLSVFHARSRERYLRARLLQEVGREEDALRWYAATAQVSPYELVYLAPAHLRRAQILDRPDRTGAAARHYARVVELWEDSDPELRPWVEDARRRRAALGASGEGG